MNRNDWQPLYNTARWVRLRRHQLNTEPLCRTCKRMGHTTLATVVDHVEPHKGDVTLFYDPDNLQSLCKDHHDSTKAREEHGGAEIGCDKDGIPLDAGHRWNVGGGDQISGGKRADIVCGPSREKNPEILSDGV